jgi:hypothetical protein
MYAHIHEHLAAIHRHELLQAAEQRRLANHLRHSHGTGIHRIAGILGVFLVKTGMKLKQFEMHASVQGI